MPRPPIKTAADLRAGVSESSLPGWIRIPLRLLSWAAGLAMAGALCLGLAIALALALAYPNLPDVSALSDYRPKLPLRIYSAERVLIGEFGEERRRLTPIKEVPQVMIDAVLAIEDSRFYSHHGVDYKGMVRAALANLGRIKSQGASTITMQVARNVYLSSEKTFTRKIYEILLTFKLEHLLSKDQILEIYMNQIYLGNRAFGFAAAAEAYFGKPLQDVTVAEAAMLAGLPKAPAANNPIKNPERARIRQLYIIDRMEQNGFLTEEQAEAARVEKLRLNPGNEGTGFGHSAYVAEMVRQLIFAQYGEQAYTRGLNVYTTLDSTHQEAAYDALRSGLLKFERRQAYRGPEQFVNLPREGKDLGDAVDEALADHPDADDLVAAVVLSADRRKVVALRQNGDQIEITGEGLEPARSGLADKAPPNLKIRRGAVIRAMQVPKKGWQITQMPEVEGAFVSLDPRTGAIKSLVGGFDFSKAKFNHVTQAWRQPGSSFKPFIYSAALEKGFMPSTIVNDAPLFFDGSVTGGQPWEPKNYDGTFSGPMTLKTALAKSKNMVSIRVLQAIGAPYAQDWVTRFGFEAARHPAYLPMALGSGSATPMQMAAAFAVFANGGYRVNPQLITSVTDQRGTVLVEVPPTPLNESTRAIDGRNAFIMDTMLQEVVRAGTGALAGRVLKRSDLRGKTGTTNDSNDAWFTGYQPTLVAVTWIGYDTPRKLGDKETGGGLALPVWIDYMQTALKGVPIAKTTVPEGVTQVGGEWYYDEYVGGNGIRSLGVEDRPAETRGLTPPPLQAPPAAEERRSILDMFRN